MATDVDVLMDMKESIAESATELARLEGQLTQAKTQLKENHGTLSVEAALTLVREIEEKRDKLGIEIDEGLDKLEEDYDWE